MKIIQIGLLLGHDTLSNNYYGTSSFIIHPNFDQIELTKNKLGEPKLQQNKVKVNLAM